MTRHIKGEEWKKVAKDTIILILPRKESNFDHNRSITEFEHLLDDFTNDVDESDLTHLDEILSLHDLSLDPQAGSFEEFKQRSLENFSNRCLHHHVFDGDLVHQICSHLNMLIVEETMTESYWMFLIKITRCRD